MRRFAILLLLAVTATAAEKTDWRRHVEKTLDGKRANVNFEETPLREALGFLGQFGGIPVNLDPVLPREARDRNVTVELDEATLREVLDRVAAEAEMAWEVRWGGVFVSTSRRLASLPASAEIAGDDSPESRALATRLREESVSLSMDAAQIAEALDFLRTVKKLNIVVDDAAKDRTKASTGRVEANVTPLDEALSLLLAPHGLGYSLMKGVVHVTAAPTPSALAASLGRAEVELTRPKMALVDAIALLSPKGKARIHLDPQVPGRQAVTLRTGRVPVAEALRLVLDSAGLAADARWGVVFVAPKERLGSLPADAPEGEPLSSSPTTFSFAGATVAEALEFVRDVKAVNLVLDPEAKAAAERSTVTLAVKDLPLRDALALLLYPRGFRFAPRHEVILVTEAD